MFKNQPKGLFALALANTGERFGYYTMLAIFLLFIQAKFGFDAAVATQIYSIFLAGVYFMPLFMLVLCNNFSSGLSYYYMLSNLITILQTWVIRKYFIDEKKLYAKLQAKASSSANKKSKWQARLEEMQRRQAQMQREREKQFRKR